MKKFRYSILGLLCTVMLTLLNSCKKYLDEQPVSAFSTEAAFSNVNTATSAVLGIYARLAGDSGYGIRLSMYYTVDADDFVGPASNASPDNDRRDIARYQATAQNAQIEAPFENLYTGIERANICIKYIPQMAAYTSGSASDQAALKRLYGEALTLRAQFYFELMRNWGDVPAQWEPSADQPTLNITRTDQKVIYDRILNDLLTAESLVPWRTEVVRDERITKGAVKGLRARIALFRGGYLLNTSTGQVDRTSDYQKYYQITRDECNDLLQRRDQHTLNSSFQNLFKNYVDAHTLDPTGEIMFEVAMAGGSGIADSKLGYYDGPRSVNGSTSLGNSSITAVPTYFYAFDQNDVRRDVTICPYFFNFDGTKTLQRLIGLPSGKFRRDWITNPSIPVNSASQYFGINWPILRFADVLLMYAEADNELNSGPSAAAISALREVRLRGFNGDATKIGTIPTDKTGFFTALANERLFEFGGEGIRKFDLIRWNLFNSTLTATRANLTAMFNKQAPYNNLPQTMTYQNAQQTINYGSSLYAPSPSTVPTGYTRVNWVSSLTTTYITSVAQYFKPGHSEVLPIPQPSIDANPLLTQNFGY
ncbi:RagB/SusD family nutrient uptake outer membrane protein [Mucilaginibacter sp. RS28]|uniref:RagB/SusD family nutrient uptake outer membrane protein n=1 Tax=Mucilaginibacter straminoryzae TaxID=2932774 RepID=A0A9X1X5J0_9SPHI|nr:RagB/SusD family nutrient uptake outer membrane protein [Mucilaginibacter straminoryzae]MCJ8210830.1 RagB/SusD family nutrient uptake outer membrane protein [Mucilaginibacter straminoryzae]